MRRTQLLLLQASTDVRWALAPRFVPVHKMEETFLAERDVVSDEVLGLIRPHFSSVKIPSTHDKVYKDECMFSFDT